MELGPYEQTVLRRVADMCENDASLAHMFWYGLVFALAYPKDVKQLHDIVERGMAGRLGMAPKEEYDGMVLELSQLLYGYHTETN